MLLLILFFFFLIKKLNFWNTFFSLGFQAPGFHCKHTFATMPHSGGCNCAPLICIIMAVRRAPKHFPRVRCHQPAPHDVLSCPNSAESLASANHFRDVWLDGLQIQTRSGDHPTFEREAEFQLPWCSRPTPSVQWYQSIAHISCRVLTHQKTLNLFLRGGQV